MPRIYELNPRLTHHYVQAFKDLDQYDESLTLKVKELGGTRFYEPEDTDGSFTGTTLTRVVIPANMSGSDPRTISRMIADYYSVGGCEHSYDCCGCASNSVTLHPKGKREYVVEIQWFRNC